MFDIFLEKMEVPAILLSSQEVLVIMIVTAVVVFVVSRGRRGGK